jgi:hypothetical protein
MSSFSRGGKDWLLVADVGDNGLDRPTYTLYLCEEPAPDADQASVIAIAFRYENGPHNCEAVAVDAKEGVILLATKVYSTQCKIFELPLPDQAPTEVAVAREIAVVPVPFATSMDITNDGRRAVMVTYSDAFQFERRESESWRQAFTRAPQQLSMPIRRQGESICYAADGATLYLTSEKQPSPFWEVMPNLAVPQPETNGASRATDETQMKHR